MATYAIGDIQGCYNELQALLDKISFSPARDTLWLTGDLVNRGSESLTTLRFIKNLSPAPKIVLGNHDLHLLALAANIGKPKRGDTLNEILQAPDCDELCAWLRQQPLLHYDATLDLTMIHAGLAPQWDLSLAQQCAHEVEIALTSADYVTFLNQMYGNEPDRWDKKLSGWDRLRFSVNCLTRLRFCDSKNRLVLKEKGSPVATPQLCPWFSVPGRAHSELEIIFGHWASLNGNSNRPYIHALDTGCVWGGELTAMRLEDRQRFSVKASRHYCQP
jgi:bis(5'-nucleosyl)-tetraphosphatase (symmetrical)